MEKETKKSSERARRSLMAVMIERGYTIEEIASAFKISEDEVRKTCEKRE